MRKIVLMASMLAMVLLVASPAMAQSVGVAEQNASAGDNSNINQQVCQNVIGDINVEGGDNIAVSQYGDIAQNNETNVTVVQSCIQAAQQNTGDNVEQNQGVIEAPAADDQYVAPEDDAADDQYVAPEDDAADDQYVAPEGDAPAADDAPAAADADAAAAADADAAAAEAPADAAAAEAPAEVEDEAVAVLPDTGGASLFTLGAGALLVAGGLLARRIVR